MGEVISIRTREEGLFSEQELFESLSPDELRDFINSTSDRIEEMHRIKQLAIDVLSGYGQEELPTA